MLAIHSNIEHGKLDTDKSGSGLRKSTASVWAVENEWNPSLKIVSLWVAVYKQSWLFMQVVVARKSGERERKKKTIQEVHLNDFVVLLNTAYLSELVPKLIKSMKNMSHPPHVSHNIQKVHF